MSLQFKGSAILVMKILQSLKGNPTSGSRNKLAAVLNGLPAASERSMIAQTQALSEAIMNNYITKHIAPGLAMPRLLNATYSRNETRMLTLNLPALNSNGKIDLKTFTVVRIETSNAQYDISIRGSWSEVDYIAFGLKESQADMRIVFDYDKEISINALAVIATLHRAGLAWEPYCDQSQDKLL